MRRAGHGEVYGAGETCEARVSTGAAASGPPPARPVPTGWGTARLVDAGTVSISGAGSHPLVGDDQYGVPVRVLLCVRPQASTVDSAGGGQVVV